MNKNDKITKIANECLQCPNPLCQKGCPINNPIKDILYKVKHNEIEEAKEILFNNSNVSPVCSILCNHEENCLGHCVLSRKGKGIPFYEVEEYLSRDFVNFNFKIKTKNHKKVAIIGAGISGISSAIDLAKEGFEVTIFEKNNFIGGVVKESLPNFGFNDNIMEDYLKILEKLEVEVKLNSEFGKNLKIEDLSKYHFVILALGTPLSKHTINQITGVVYDAMELLKLAKNNCLPISNKNILVIGGGNVAIDIARALRKNDNNVKIVYRRNKENAPSSNKEIAHSLEENIEWLECLAPTEVMVDSNITILKVEKMNLIQEESSSRLTFVPTGEFSELECDLVVEALGTNANYEYLREALPNIFEGKWPKAEYHMEETNQYYFVTGDYYLGATSFVEATQNAKNTVERILKICK